MAPSSLHQFFHGGSLDGFETEIFIDVERKNSIVFLSNGGKKTNHQGIVKDLVQRFYTGQAQ
jgi:hypothetical protein